MPLLALLLSLIAPLPAPNAPIPRDPAALAATLTITIRDLRATTWTGEGKTPDDVTYLALYHERMLRRLAARRRLGDTALERLPADVRGEARDTVGARGALAATPRGRARQVRVPAAAPAAELRRNSAAAQRASGI